MMANKEIVFFDTIAPVIVGLVASCKHVALILQDVHERCFEETSHTRGSHLVYAILEDTLQHHVWNLLACYASAPIKRNVQRVWQEGAGDYEKYVKSVNDRAKLEVIKVQCLYSRRHLTCQSVYQFIK